jgi:hypothetical protein
MNSLLRREMRVTAFAYTECTWTVWTKFTHEFHIQEKRNIRQHPFKNAGVVAASSKLTINTSGQKRILIVYFILDTSSRSTLMSVGIVGDSLVGRHRLTGNHYRDFLLHDLSKLQEDVPLAVRARMCNMHKGAPAHFCRAVWDVLCNTYHDRWIGSGGRTEWPARSLDLNQLEFYLWWHLKPLVYSSSVDNEEALHRRILDACQTIRNYPCTFVRMLRPIMRRALNLIDDNLGTW